MDDLRNYLFSSTFIPHGQSYLWRPDVLALHAGSDALIALDKRDRHREDRANYVASPMKRIMGDCKDLYGLCSDGSTVPVEIGLNPVSGSLDGEVVASVVDAAERMRELLNSLLSYSRVTSRGGQFVVESRRTWIWEMTQ